MDEMIYANITLDIFSIVLSVLPIVYLISNHRYRQKLNQYFLGVCISNILMIAGDLPDWLLPTAPKYRRNGFLSAAFGGLLHSFRFCPVFFYRYIMEYLQLTGRAKKICLLYALFLCSVQVIFSAISPFTGSIFYVTDDGYQRGPLFLISQLVPLLCYMLFMALVLIYRKKLLPNLPRAVKT